MSGYKGRQGRKQKPSTLKLIQGTFRPDRENKRAPKPAKGIPEPSDCDLSPSELKQYERVCKILDDMKVLTKADSIAVELLAHSLDTYYLARAQVKKDILAARAAKIKYVADSMTHLMNESKRTIMTLLSRCGLEPTARANLNIVDSDKKEVDEYSNL